jgi:hypothetical protein
MFGRRLKLIAKQIQTDKNKPCVRRIIRFQKRVTSFKERRRERG